MQYAIVIIDGASGYALSEFDGKTTLEASHTPALDTLASKGTVGLMQNVPDHLESSSNVACMSICGYNPSEYPIGRGAIEGAAMGIDLKPGQVAFRMNLCYVENGIMKSYSTDNISTEDSHALAADLKAELDDKTFSLYPGVSFRHALVVNGYPEMVDLHYEAPHDHTDQDITELYKPRALDPSHQDAADLLADYLAAANEVLRLSGVNKRRVAEGKLPANFAWLTWPGVKPSGMHSFSEEYSKNAAMNSAVDLLDGIAKLTNMKIYKFDGVTDGPDNDFAAQGVGALEMLRDGNDVVIIHIESPDTAGHDGRPDEKKAAIELSDSQVIQRLQDYACDHPLRIAVMPDHPTPLSTRKHSREPVPFVIAGPGIAHNGRTRLTEAEGEASGLLVNPGYLFMQDVLFA